MDFPTLLQKINQDAEKLTIDAVKQRLADLIPAKIPPVTSILSKGTLLYRARVCDENLAKDDATYADLMYPAVANAAIGRVNRQHDPVFYASCNRNAALFELASLKPGDTVILSVWQNVLDGSLVHLGYTEQRRQQASACVVQPSIQPNAHAIPNLAETISFSRHNVPVPEQEKLLDLCGAQAGDHIVHAALTGCVGKTETYKYKLPIALAELHRERGLAQDAQSFAGLAYPSAQLWPEADNLALQPDFVDGAVRFQKAYALLITDVTVERIDAVVQDVTQAHSTGDRLIWRGSPAHQ